MKPVPAKTRATPRWILEGEHEHVIHQGETFIEPKVRMEFRNVRWGSDDTLFDMREHEVEDMV